MYNFLYLVLEGYVLPKYKIKLVIASLKRDNVFSNKEDVRECIFITNWLLLAMTVDRVRF